MVGGVGVVARDLGDDEGVEVRLAGIHMHGHEGLAGYSRGQVFC